MKKHENEPMTRRAFVASVAAGVGAVALSGCAAGSPAEQSAPKESSATEQAKDGSSGEIGSASGGDSSQARTPGASKIYMTEDISPAGLMAAFTALGVQPQANGGSIKAVSDYMGPENVAYVNVMNRLSVDCDCDGNPAEPTMADIGILASTDPVALDRACVDLVYAAPDGADVIERIESRNGTHTLDHAEAIGLGSQSYELIRID